MTALAPNMSIQAAGTPALDPETVIARLEEAGRTLLALPRTGPTTRLVQSGMEWVRDAQDTVVHERMTIRPAVPDANITRMDEALGWIPLIPIDKYVLRRVVGARSLVNPMHGRHLFSWRRLGTAIGADHKAVKQWHAKGIDIIVARLRAPSRTPDRSLPQPARHHRSPNP